MGRPAFLRWLTEAGAPDGTGVYYQDQFATWAELRARGADLAHLVSPNRAYLVDPTEGLAAFAAFFAVAATPDVLLLWANAAAAPMATRRIAPGLYECADALSANLTRPLWGTLTSGSSGTPKVPLGYADQLEAIALHYYRALHLPLRPNSRTGVHALATCLPLEYAGAFMMVVLPALYLRRDLVVFPPSDWSGLHATARTRETVALTVPSLMAAASINTPQPVDCANLTLLMASGYLAQPRMRLARQTFLDVRLANSYGASETGVMTLDLQPDTHQHVGQALAGKPIWLRDVDATGVGKIATTGVDCREFYWDAGNPAGRGIAEPDGSVAVTDYGHFDATGNLYLDGRIDGGEKLHGVTVYPRRIERHILGLDGVADVKVTVEHLASGLDRLAARVIGDVTGDVVREYCAQLPAIERPTTIECVPEGVLAYTRNGKLSNATG